MTVSIPKIPMENELIIQYADFLRTSTKLMRELRKCMARAENVTGGYLCTAMVYTKGEKPVMHMSGSSWLKIASVWPHDLKIERHYTSGPEAERPWGTHLFRVSLEHNGVEYFALMTGTEIDQNEIGVFDKEALMRGDG